MEKGGEVERMYDIDWQRVLYKMVNRKGVLEDCVLKGR